MKLMVNHQTHYFYSDLVNSSIQYIKMTPSTNSHQCVKHWDVSVPGVREMKLGYRMTSIQISFYSLL